MTELICLAHWYNKIHNIRNLASCHYGKIICCKVCEDKERCLTSNFGCQIAITNEDYKCEVYGLTSLELEDLEHIKDKDYTELRDFIKNGGLKNYSPSKRWNL